MLDVAQIQSHILALNKGDEPSRREAIRSLKQTETADWAAAPAKVVQTLVESLRQQLPRGHNGDVKPPLVRQEVVVILGQLGVTMRLGGTINAIGWRLVVCSLA